MEFEVYLIHFYPLYLEQSTVIKMWHLINDNIISTITTTTTTTTIPFHYN